MPRSTSPTLGKESAHGSRRKKAVRVRVGKHDARIDKKIAPLIRELWRAGIDTIMSLPKLQVRLCLGGIYDAGQAARFLNIAASYESGRGNLYNRMNPRFSGDKRRVDLRGVPCRFFIVFGGV